MSHIATFLLLHFTLSPRSGQGTLIISGQAKNRLIGDFLLVTRAVAKGEEEDLSSSPTQR